MRQRTTWNTNEILNRTAATSPTAAMNRTADPYAMNQDHIKQQPSADKYLTGDPSAFAEDITTPNNWEVEYSGGAVKRNEIGMPEDRPETFNHPEKTASVNHDLLLKKADMTVRIARRMLGANAPEGAIEEQAASLMHLPDAEVINTYNRMAGEMPPALKEHMEQKQQGAKQQESAEQQAQEQAKQAAIRGDKTAFDAAVARLVQIRLANDPQQAPAQQQQQAGQQQQGQAQQQAGQDQQSAWYDSKAPRPGHPGPDTGPYAGQQQQAQGQQAPMMQQQGQGQQMPPAQQAGQQQFPGGQFPTAQGQQAPMQQQSQGQAPAQGVEAQVQQMIEQAAQQMQQGKQANGQQAPAQQQQAGQQQQAQGQQAPAQQQAGQQQQAQGQQAPMQQQGAGYQQAQGQQQPPAQQQAGQQQQGQMQQQGMGYQQQSGLQNPNQNISPNYQQQQAGQQQGMPVQASDDQLIDQMLMPSGVAPAAGGGQIAEMDIQMEAPSMDIGDVSFQPGEDDMLRQLFSNDEAMAAQQAQSAQEQGQAQQGQVQANIRTAALRTVGTRPSAGVARIGGAGAPPSRGQEVDKLTSLWQSAPDVREVFGLKTT